jgi:hypothetical protein
MIKKLILNKCDLRLAKNDNTPATARDLLTIEVVTNDQFIDSEIFFQYGDSPIVTKKLDEQKQVEAPIEVIGYPGFKAWMKTKKNDIEVYQTNEVEIPCYPSSRFIEAESPAEQAEEESEA